MPVNLKYIKSSNSDATRRLIINENFEKVIGVLTQLNLVVNSGDDIEFATKLVDLTDVVSTDVTSGSRYNMLFDGSTFTMTEVIESNISLPSSDYTGKKYAVVHNGSIWTVEEIDEYSFNGTRFFIDDSLSIPQHNQYILHKKIILDSSGVINIQDGAELIIT